MAVAVIGPNPMRQTFPGCCALVASGKAAAPPSSARAREIARRIALTAGVLVLAVVAYYGVPVILEVPEMERVSPYRTIRHNDRRLDACRLVALSSCPRKTV